MNTQTNAALAAALLMAASSVATPATCDGTAITGDTLVTYIQGNLTCAYKPDNTDGKDANERWSSIQTGDGFPSASLLYEYARGAGHPVDPTKEVGTWALVNDDNDIVTDVDSATRVQYKYGSNPEYNWEVRKTVGSTTPAPYEFCDPANENERIAYAKEAVSDITPLTDTDDKCGWPNF
jgi:hypothetical protein